MSKVVNIKGADVRMAFLADPDSVYIGRYTFPIKGRENSALPGSAWANPFSVKEYGREGAIARYRVWVGEQIAEGRLDLDDLVGKTLGCWCAPEACHGDVLLDLLVRHRAVDDEFMDAGEAAYSGMFPTAADYVREAAAKDADEPDEDIPGEDDADNS